MRISRVVLALLAMLPEIAVVAVPADAASKLRLRGGTDVGAPDAARSRRAAETARTSPQLTAEQHATQSDAEDVPPLALVEMGARVQAGATAKAGWTGEHGYCELCIYAVHQVQYGELPSCGGSPRAYSFDACSQVVQSMLAMAQDVVHLISYGCYQYDAYKGWQTVKPCPAHVICGRLPNIYDTDQQTHCPADFHFRFPHALGGRGPKVFNPLLSYAVKQYQNNGPTSSVLQLPGVAAGLPRFSEHHVELGGQRMDGGTPVVPAAPAPQSSLMRFRAVDALPASQQQLPAMGAGQQPLPQGYGGYGTATSPGAQRPQQFGATQQPIPGAAPPGFMSEQPGGVAATAASWKPQQMRFAAARGQQLVQAPQPRPIQEIMGRPQRRSQQTSFLGAR